MLDELTGLPNFRALASWFPPRDMAPRKTQVLVYIDVGGMAHVTAVLGPPRGDAVLQRLARLLTIYWPNWEAARVGGDEFVLLAPDMPTAVETAARVKELTEREFQSERGEVRTNAAAKGISTPPPRLLQLSIVLQQFEGPVDIHQVLGTARAKLHHALNAANGAAVQVLAT